MFNGYAETAAAKDEPTLFDAPTEQPPCD
jgi:hypothetical protein